MPEVSPLEMSKFPNETFLGSVKKQENELRKLGLEHNPKLVIYNRVPKCGSTTTLDIIRYLKRKLKFNVFNDIAPKMKVCTDFLICSLSFLLYSPVVKHLYHIQSFYENLGVL